MNALTPALWTRLQTILKTAFGKNGLLQLATVKLVLGDVRFADLVDFGRSEDQIAFQMIEVAEEHQLVDRLVAAVAAERPERPDVQDLLTDLGLKAVIVTATSQASSRREAIIRFSVRFQLTQEQFRYLNAYKQLHDLLHKIHSFQPQLESVLALLRRPGEDRPDPTVVTDPLLSWVDETKKSARETEFPEKLFRWVNRLEKATNDLIQQLNMEDPAAIEAPKLDRAVEILAHLPAEEQRRLNEELVECALRLKTGELIASIDHFLTDLDAAGLGTADIRASFDAFRTLCQQLDGLIRDHNLCQEVDGALQEAAGLPEVSPDALSQWTDIKAWLEEIASHRPADLRANRPVESTRLFEEAARAATTGDRKEKKRIADAFARLQARFDDLFLHTDEALLEVTRDLLTSIRLLDATLKRYS